jgi:multidrug efflux pump subunit AcrB
MRSLVWLIIDDAIVVVEAIHTKLLMGRSRQEAVVEAVREILKPLVGSTIGPVMVFVPLAFLDGVPGVFFRALAVTMVVSLLASLALAVTLTPSLAAWLLRVGKTPSGQPLERAEEGGFILRRIVRAYEGAGRVAFAHPLLTLLVSGLVLLCGIGIYMRLQTDFLPKMDEGGFVIDYVAPAGTSLAETDRALLEVEKILRQTPEIESYSRRTGAALGFHIVEPNTGDFLVKLRSSRKKKTEEVISELRKKLKESQPHIEWEFPGILSDLLNDLTGSPEPIEIKIFSTDLEFLKKKAPEIKEAIEEKAGPSGTRLGVKGVVDAKSGLIVAGPLLRVRVRPADAQRFGMNADDVAQALDTAMIGQTASSILQADRIVEIRVRAEPSSVDRMATLGNLPLRSPNGLWVLLSQIADITEDPGQLELRREDLRQNVAVTARLEGRDLGSAIEEIRQKLSRDPSLPPGMIEYGGLYHEQQESFRNLLVVLILAILLVFAALLVEFNSLAASVSIVFGAVLSLFGTVLALLVTGTSLNIISILGAIIGIGIVHKNGILMLDWVEHLEKEGVKLEDALLGSGRRRLRPVLMTSMAAALGMLPLAYGIGSGADMLRPLAIAVIGALCISVLLSLVATPALYLLLRRSAAMLAGGEKGAAK